MNITIQPALDGIAAERLRQFAARMTEQDLDEGVVRELVNSESQWVARTRALNGQTFAYQASARLLADLRMLKWRVRADSCGIELESPPHPRLRAKAPGAVAESKEAVRKELAPALSQQFADPSVREFRLEGHLPTKTEVEHDTTTATQPGDVCSIVRRWKKAHKEGRDFLLAANESARLN
jgi:hypothetical protein